MYTLEVFVAAGADIDKWVIWTYSSNRSTILLLANPGTQTETLGN